MRERQPSQGPSSSELSRLRRTLLDWFDASRRDLPWRRERDPYRVWLSEVMLQQTTVTTALRYYERFLARFPTVAALASAQEEEVLALWSGLGYYRRAKNLLRAARIVVQERGGRFPESAEGWRALPGIGTYTGAAIASLAQGERVAAVDGNVERVLARRFRIEGDPRRGDAARAIRDWAARIVDAERPGELNEALMELGATVCTTPAPGCERCPWSRDCRARAAGVERTLPPARRRRAPVYLLRGAALIEGDRGARLVERLPENAPNAGLWDLPSVTLSRSTRAPRSSRRGREWDARLASRFARLFEQQKRLRITPGGFLFSLQHVITHHRISLMVIEARLRDGPLAGDWRWIEPGDVETAPLTGSARRILASNPPAAGG